MDRLDCDSGYYDKLVKGDGMLKHLMVCMCCVAALAVSAVAESPVLGASKWAGNGERALVVTGPQTISIINSNGELIANVPLEGDVVDFGISPKDAYFVYTTADKGCWVAGMDGTKKMKISDKPVINWSWCGDDSKLLFTTAAGTADLEEISTNIVDINDGRMKLVNARRHKPIKRIER
jgi:hypothetical protein